jgi:hypothetical protein
LLAGARIHAEHIRRAFVAGDGVRERHRGGDQLAGALGDLTDCERRTGIHRAGEEVDLADLEQLVGLLHSDRWIGLLVLEAQFDRTTHDATCGIDFLGRKLEAPFHLLANAGIGTAQRGDDADLDRVLALCGAERRGGQQHRKTHRGQLRDLGHVHSSSGNPL